MKASLPTLPLIVAAMFLIVLLVLEMEFSFSAEALLAFIPAALWGGALIKRGRT